MARPLRIEYPGAFYHVMNRGANRQTLFQDAGDRPLFLQTLDETIQRWKVRVHAYSLMANHYHLLMETPIGNLSRAMRHLDGLYTQRFNKKHFRDGPLMRGRFKSILVDRDAYFLELLRYIHLNGVRAQLVPDPQLDPHSSHRDYLCPSTAPRWLTRDTALSFFSGDPQTASASLDAFVKQGVSNDFKKILEGRNWPALMGTKYFANKIHDTFIEPKPLDPEVPQQKPLRRLAPPRRVIWQVMKEFDVSFRAMCEQNSKNHIHARNVCIFLLRMASYLSYAAIGRYMGGLQKSQVARICQKGELLPPSQWQIILVSCEGKRET